MRQVLPIVGAVVGSFFGAPQIGFMIGSLIGNAVDPQVIKGPSIGDGQATTANEGNPINLVYGTATVGGQLIDRSEVYKTIRRKRQGKGGPKVEEERFSQTFAIAIGEGPGELLSIMQDEKLVYDVRAEGRQISDEENAKYAQNFRFYRGTEDQMPDPALEGLHGVGNTPAYRGLMYIVFERFDTTDRGGSIPNFRFEVSRSNAVLQPGLIHSKMFFTGSIGSYEPKSYLGTIPSSNSFTNCVLTSDKKNMFFTRTLGAQGIYYYKFNDGIENWELTNIFPFNSMSHYNTLFLSYDEKYLITTFRRGGIDGLGDDEYGIVSFKINENNIQVNSYLTFGKGVYSPNSDQGTLCISSNGSKISFVGGRIGQKFIHLINFDKNNGVLNNIKNIPISTSIPGGARSYFINENILIITLYNSVITFNLTTEEIIDTKQTLNTNNFYENNIYIKELGVLFSPTNNTANSIYHNPYFNISNSGAISEIKYNFIDQLENQKNQPISNNVVSISQNGYYMCILEKSSPVNELSGFNFYSYNNDNGRYEKIDFISKQYISNEIGNYLYDTLGVRGLAFSGDPSYVSVSDQYYLQDIIRDIADRCKVPQEKLNLSDISDITVRGLVVSGTYPVKNAIESLQETFFFDTAEYNERLNFIKRGHDAEITITNDDLIIDEEVDQKRESAREYPNKVNLLYQNATIRYDKAKATAELNSDNLEQSIEKSFEVPIVFNEDEAAQVADKQLKIAWAEADGEFNFTLPTNLYDQLVPSDVFWYYNDKNDTTKRFRIIEIERADGELKVKAKTDRQSAYISNVEGVPVPVPMPPPPTIAGPTEFVYLNIPALVDQNDVLGYYVSATGSTVAYRGSEIERKTHDIEEDFESVASIEPGTTMGYLLDSVSDASEHYSDTTNIIHLKLYNEPDFEVFQTVNQDVLLRENNAIAISREDGTAEIIQFRDVENLGDGEYKLSYLLRGRLNSGTDSHDIGAKVVWLEDVHTVLADSSEIGDIFEHRATSFGESPETSDVYVNDFSQPLMQTEFPVDLLRYEVDGGDLIISWSPRERFGSDIHPIRSQNWMGYKIEIQDGGILREYESEVPNLTVPTSTFSSSNLDVIVYQVNRFTDKGPGVQISVEL